MNLLLLIAGCQVITNILDKNGVAFFKHQFPIWLLAVWLIFPLIDISFFSENIPGGCGTKKIGNPILFWIFGGGALTLFIRYLFYNWLNFAYAK